MFCEDPEILFLQFGEVHFQYCNDVSEMGMCLNNCHCGFFLAVCKIMVYFIIDDTLYC